MKSIREFVGQELKWTQPNTFKMEYELRAGEELIGTLRFRTSLGSFATAECGDGCWTFKRTGFFKPQVTIRICGSESEIAIFRNKTWNAGGSLELADGRKLLANTNFWQTKFEFKTEDNQPLFYFKHGGYFHLSASVEIQPAGASFPELPWLVILGWYVTILLRYDSAVVAA